jgi:hypothetical protein
MHHAANLRIIFSDCLLDCRASTSIYVREAVGARFIRYKAQKLDERRITADRWMVSIAAEILLGNA